MTECPTLQDERKTTFLNAVAGVSKLRRLAFTLPKKAIEDGKLLPPRTHPRDIDDWYSKLIVEFGKRLTRVVSLCIFSDRPQYYEGTREDPSESLFVQKRDIKDLDHGEWPMGIRDNA